MHCVGQQIARTYFSVYLSERLHLLNSSSPFPLSSQPLATVTEIWPLYTGAGLNLRDGFG